MGKRINNINQPHKRKRLVKRLAARPGHGRRCFYCGCGFHDGLEGITFDHYVPYRYWRTGRHDALVLACAPCNEAKADTLPWTVAYLLLSWYGQLQQDDVATAA